MESKPERDSDASVRTAILGVLPDAAFVINRAGAVASSNAAAVALFGWPKEELLDKPLWELMVKGERDRLRHCFEVTPASLPTDLRGLRKNETSFPVEFQWRFVSAVGYVGIARDRTSQEETKARAIRNAKLSELGQIAAGFAHELNTPLSVICSSCEFLLEKAKSGDLPTSTLVEFLERMFQTAVGASKVIVHFRLFSRDSGPEVEPFDLSEAASGALMLLRERLRLRGVVVETSLAKGVTVVGSKNRIEQVVLNLINNAVEAMVLARDKRLDVRVRRADTHASLLVRDAGSGIAPEVRQKIGTPFFTTKPDGTGLGLWTCYGIVKDHHGEIDIRGEPGKGTSVEVRFPLPRT